jgi:hypothetical protein
MFCLKPQRVAGPGTRKYWLLFIALCNGTLCARSVRSNQSFGHSYYFPLLFLKCNRTADVFVATLTMSTTAHLKHMP